MITALSLCSVPFFALMWIIAMAPSPKPFPLARPLPRLRPSLRAWATVIVILAIDFAAATSCGTRPEVAAQLCLWDGALTLGVIVSLMTAQRSILELWMVAVTIGMLACLVVMATMTALATH